MNRDQRTADLAVHGWEPIVAVPSSWRGIFNDNLGLGYVVRRDTLEAHPIFLRSAWPTGEWSDVSDAVLDAIDARLSET